VSSIVGCVDRHQENLSAIYDHFPAMFKIDGDLVCDHRLYLADAPVLLCRMPDQHTGFPKPMCHIQVSSLQAGVPMSAGQDLSALISTRICHDLINPIGAISNGLELLGDISQQQSPELDLVAGSAEQASAKLSFFRIAFGNASEGSETSGPMIARLVEAMYVGARFRPSWTVLDGTLPKGEVKLALLLMLGVETSLKLGGSCTVAREGDAWRLDATGPRIEPNLDHWAFATDGRPTEALSSKEVQFAVARDTSLAIGRRVQMSSGEAGMRVQF